MNPIVFRRFPLWRRLLVCRHLLRILLTKPDHLRLLRSHFIFSKELRILPEDLEHRLVDRFDLNRCLFLSPSSAVLFDFAPSALYVVRLVADRGKRCVERLFRVVILNPIEFGSIHGIYLSHEGAFNCFISGDCAANLDEVKRFRIHRYHLAGRLQDIDFVSVHQILTAKYPNYVDYGNALEEYFGKTRIIGDGDTFSLSVNQFDANTDNHIFYKVKLSDVQNSEATFETNSRTTFYQLTSSASKLPIRHVSTSVTIPSALHGVSSRIVRLISGYLRTDVDSRFCILLSGAGGSGKKLVTAKAAELLGFNLIEVSCYELWSDISGNSEGKIANFFKNAAKLAPCICVFKDLSVLGFDQNSTEIDERVMTCFSSQLATAPRDLSVVFTCDHMEVKHLPISIRALVTSELRIPDLMENDRLEWLDMSPLSHLDVFKIAKNTSGFVISELIQMASDSAKNAYCDGARRQIGMKDVDHAVEIRNKLFADSVGAPQIPHVDWSEVGGLEKTKHLICESLEMNVEGSERTLKRTGVVLYGPPGCGKTLLAKAVASQFNITFLSVKGPEMLNKYIGQSEENIRNLFARARMASPCVIFFDELDALAPNRGRSGDSGGVMDRIVSQLLSELDSLHSKPNCNVFVMAATNRPDLLDPSLLTPGRFDKTVYVNAAESAEAKKKILEAVSRKVKLDGNVDFLQIAKECPTVMSGADLYSVVSKATMEAVRAAVEDIESGQAAEADVSITVKMGYLRKALSQISSSLSSDDVSHYSSLQHTV
ncbi:hypothetical protein QR680_005614 [Steinernema hermaphroditum]|uniref:Peroxisomal ATPase PEX1 n=1 Tax=Steinernema hermaphroditum TaxID=289476 RepID=A0AA39HU06_9BILA|nr:hypothetical protein QR680_005614 [Steinernema hermaphroditum]